MRRVVVTMFALLATACTTRTQSAEQQPQVDSGAPVITHIEPDTVALGQAAVPTLVIHGNGFVTADGQNTVRVGRALFERVGSDASGTTLRFALSLTYIDTTATGRPSAFTPGQYTVSVVTPRGTSNTLTLTMIR